MGIFKSSTVTWNSGAKIILRNMFWELIYNKPNPFSDITIMTQQQAIFWLNIACNNHNPDGTDYDIHRFYIHTCTCIIQFYKFKKGKAESNKQGIYM